MLSRVIIVPSAFSSSFLRKRTHTGLGAFGRRHWYALEEGPGQYGVHATDRTFPLIQAHAKVVNGLYAEGKKMCTAK